MYRTRIQGGKQVRSNGTNGSVYVHYGKPFIHLTKHVCEFYFMQEKKKKKKLSVQITGKIELNERRIFVLIDMWMDRLKWKFKQKLLPSSSFHYFRIFRIKN